MTFADAAAAPRAFSLGAYVSALAFDQDGTAAFALGNGAVGLLRADAPHEAAPQLVELHDGAALSLVAHPAGGFVSGGDDGRVVHVTLEAAMHEIAAFKGKWIDALAAHPRAGLFAAAVGREMQLFGRDAPRGLGPHPSTVTDLDFSPDGSRLAAAHYGGVSIWTVRNPADTPRKLAWKGSHLKLRYSPNGKLLATATQENALHVWRLASGSDMQMAGYPAKIKSLAWSVDSLLLMSSGAEPFVCWSYAGRGPEGQPPIEFGGAANGVLLSAIAAHPAKPFAAGGYDTGAIHLADLTQRRAVPLKDAGGGAISALAWSPDGARLAYGSEDGAAGVIQVALR